MSMFASNDDTSRLAASELAAHQVTLWEKNLGFRVHLQRVVDLSNKLPVGYNQLLHQANNTFAKDYAGSLSSLEEIIIGFSDTLDKQLPVKRPEKDIKQSRKRLREHLSDEDPLVASAALWDCINSNRKALLPFWKDTLNKWHARAHFGSEHKKSQLKVFNQSVWDHIEMQMADERKNIEKSRKLIESKDKIKDPAQQTEYDEEVYDDRQFYSMLLKTFIASSTANRESAGNLRPDDMEALRQFKRSKQTVDRKASKGRKIRYIVHQKLQNFMFPIAPPTPALDSDILFKSLFQ